MAFPNFILANFRWKLVAFALALAVWFTVRFSLLGDIRPGWFVATEEPNYSSIPVQTLTVPGDQRVFQISPREVEVRVKRLSSRADRILSAADIRAFVIVSEVSLVADISRVMEVTVHAPDGFGIVAVNPASVAVEQISAPAEPPSTQSLTNSLIAP